MPLRYPQLERCLRIPGDMYTEILTQHYSEMFFTAFQQLAIANDVFFSRFDKHAASKATTKMLVSLTPRKPHSENVNFSFVFLASICATL